MTDEPESAGPPWDRRIPPAPGPPPGEPDYRMSLAAERTYLAYVRTSLALTAAGVAVVGALPDVGQEGLRRVIGVLLVALGVTVALTARHRWRVVTEAMRHGRPLPRGWVGLTLTGGMVAAGVLGLVLVLRI